VSETDVPADLRREFWVQVAIFNVAVLAAGVGLLFAVFTARTTAALALLGGGVVSFLHGYRRYRAVTERNG